MGPDHKQSIAKSFPDGFVPPQLLAIQGRNGQAETSLIPRNFDDIGAAAAVRTALTPKSGAAYR